MTLDATRRGDGFNGEVGRRSRPSLAVVLLACAAVVGVIAPGTRQAGAHTNNPSLYIRYAGLDQVDWANPGAAPWSFNYFADPSNPVSLNVLVGAFIDTGGTNSPPPTSERMKASTYSFFLTDFAQGSKFSIVQAIAATNGIWGGQSLEYKSLSTTMLDVDGAGLFMNNSVGFSGLNTKFAVGNGLSSALQISLKPSQMQSGDTLTFEPGLPTEVVYADGSVHAATSDESTMVNLVPSGSIFYLPEPSTLLLLGPGMLALLGLRRRRSACSATTRNN